MNLRCILGQLEDNLLPEEHEIITELAKLPSIIITTYNSQTVLCLEKYVTILRSRFLGAVSSHRGAHIFVTSSSRLAPHGSLSLILPW